MAVGGTDVGSDPNQEVHDIVVASTDGIVERRDALVVGLARITHLERRRRLFINTVDLLLVAHKA